LFSIIIHLYFSVSGIHSQYKVFTEKKLPLLFLEVNHSSPPNSIRSSSLVVLAKSF